MRLQRVSEGFTTDICLLGLEKFTWLDQQMFSSYFSNGGLLLR